MAKTGNITKFWEWGRKILCVGRNYREHIKELKNVEPTKPLIFFKPTSSYLLAGNDIRIPGGCQNLHHEIELGVVIGKPGSKIEEENAMEHVVGYVLALDMTARDWQDEIKAKGWPWTFAKGFDTSCPISNFIPKEKITDPQDVNIWLKLNGVFKQQGCTKDMIFTIPKLLNYISQNIALEAGDLILTGTPQGVGQVLAGDIIECGMGSDSLMKFSVVES